MGFFQEICHGIKCDKCGEIYESIEGFSLFPYDGDVIENAHEDDWHDIDGKWYCPNCCHYDEELDEFVPNKEIKL